MSSKGSLNKVTLIGNVVRDPEMREASPGTMRCTFALATNRSWRTESGEEKESTEYHRIVAWQKLAEICGKILQKGRKVYVEGRLSTREWDTPEGQKHRETEIIMEDLVVLDSPKDLNKEEAVIA
jgi:single-strand DNA-binding protein